MPNRIWKYLTHNEYDRHGKLKMPSDRLPDMDAFSIVHTSPETVDMVLSGICESFDIDQSQKFCIRPEDNLGDIYRAMTKYQLCDDLEYERLHSAMTEWIGDFDWAELGSDINFTVKEVIDFVTDRQVAQQGDASDALTGAGDL